jgi:hypothetical protein
VIGQEFRLDVLQHVAGLGEHVIFAALEEAHARAIIEESSGIGALLRFRFTHSFSEGLCTTRSSRPAGCVGAARLEQCSRRSMEIYGDRLEDHAGELALHYAHSWDPADLVQAIIFDGLATEQAMRLFRRSSTPIIAARVHRRGRSRPRPDR